jgi:hypothetical protein
MTVGVERRVAGYLDARTGPEHGRGLWLEPAP